MAWFYYRGEEDRSEVIWAKWVAEWLELETEWYESPTGWVWLHVFAADAFDEEYLDAYTNPTFRG